MQGDTTLDRSRGGLGLGLALVRGVVQMHGGRVDARSDGPGTGAELIVELPVEVEDVPRRDTMPSLKVMPARRVLVIEDNTDAADSLRDLLEFGGHRVEVAYSGPQGIERARTLRPDLVLCDIGLPGLDGYGVAKAIRADETLRATHLVAVSGYAQPEDLARAREAGFDGHIAKPPTLERLEEVLGKLSAIATQ
jgi:CheY-like chemotaxis protein